MRSFPPSPCLARHPGTITARAGHIVPHRPTFALDSGTRTTASDSMATPTANCAQWCRMDAATGSGYKTARLGRCVPKVAILDAGGAPFYLSIYVCMYGSQTTLHVQCTRGCSIGLYTRSRALRKRGIKKVSPSNPGPAFVKQLIPLLLLSKSLRK